MPKPMYQRQQSAEPEVFHDVLEDASLVGVHGLLLELQHFHEHQQLAVLLLGVRPVPLAQLLHLLGQLQVHRLLEGGLPLELALLQHHQPPLQLLVVLHGVPGILKLVGECLDPGLVGVVLVEQLLVDAAELMHLTLEVLVSPYEVVENLLVVAVVLGLRAGRDVAAHEVDLLELQLQLLKPPLGVDLELLQARQLLLLPQVQLQVVLLLPPQRLVLAFQCRHLQTEVVVLPLEDVELALQLQDFAVELPTPLVGLGVPVDLPLQISNILPPLRQRISQRLVFAADGHQLVQLESLSHVGLLEPVQL